MRAASVLMCLAFCVAPAGCSDESAPKAKGKPAEGVANPKPVALDAAHERLFEAVRGRDAKAVAALLDQYPALIEARDGNGITPLLRAVGNRNAEIIELLLARSADPNASGGPAGITPIQWAFELNTVDTRIVLLLLEHGANANTKDHSGNPILMRAVCRAGRQVVEAFVSKGADVAVPDKSPLRLTALHYAACSGDVETAAYLIDHGADVNAKSIDGESVLAMALAAQEGPPKFVDTDDDLLLLKRTARQVVLDAGRGKDFTAMLGLLRSRGAKP